MFFLIVIVIHVFLSLLLIAIILLQAGRGGLSETFGGGTTQSLFGTQTASFLTRTTTVCAVLFFATCLSLAVLSSQRDRSLVERLGAGMHPAHRAATTPIHHGAKPLATPPATHPAPATTPPPHTATPTPAAPTAPAAAPASALPDASQHQSTAPPHAP